MNLAPLEKPDRKGKILIQLGIDQGQAYAWSRTRNEEGIHVYHKKITRMSNGRLGSSSKSHFTNHHHRKQAKEKSVG